MKTARTLLAFLALPLLAPLAPAQHVRPHRVLPAVRVTHLTAEVRVVEGVATPTLRETVAIAALAQTLVAWCIQRIEDDDLPAPPREWTVSENRWLALRYGIDAALIVEDTTTGRPSRRPVRDLLRELVEELMPTAEALGNEAELASVLDILEIGSGTERQRRLVDNGGSLLDVVRHLTGELASDRPTKP